MNELVDTRTFVLGISLALMLGVAFVLAWMDHNKR